MFVAEAADKRELNSELVTADLVVVGGGMAGVCCAITAARAGLKVALIQDRPVLGGNASSEVRLWVLGATSHMGNNNRWAREGGVVDEILVENMYRNPEGNALIFDALLLEKVSLEPNIRLLLNTGAYEVHKRVDAIASVTAFCSQNSTRYHLTAPLFCDASGDGIVGFLAGAAFRMGAERREEFGEGLAPDSSYGELLGHSIYFYSKDTGLPVRFVAPSFALKDVPSAIPRYREFKLGQSGCKLWWIEYGGRLDTVHETEAIKWELWKVVYGVWDHIKNSGLFPEASTHTLEWVGTIPGKRESRRFEGDYMLIQQDLVEQRSHPDAVAYGGWAIDLHPADGVFSDRPGCMQYHSKGVYGIPYRTMYSLNVSNLFLAGRIISASHIAFGSSRVMATVAHAAQAVGMAAAACVKHGLQPRDLTAPVRMASLQRDLIRAGQYIPEVPLDDVEDLARSARLISSSRLMLDSLPPAGQTATLAWSIAQMLPLAEGATPRFTFTVEASKATELRAELRISSKRSNHTPDVTLAVQHAPLTAGAKQQVTFDFAGAVMPDDRNAFVCMMANPDVSVHTTDRRVTGILSVEQRYNPAVAKSSRQEPPPGSGIDAFEFWTPQRRPAGRNLAMTIHPPLDAFGPTSLTNGFARPTHHPNAWVADPAEATAHVTLEWEHPQTIGRVELTFDADYDHPMESVLQGHPESVTPFVVRRYRLRDCAGRLLHEGVDNHLTRNTVRFASPVRTTRLVLEVERPSPDVPAAVFEIRCYAE